MRSVRSSLIGWAFFLSGFAAMIYQVVWQRALYAIFGINIESVTVVVTAFLAGLGFGSLLGGRLSKRRGQLLRLFALAELAVGMYGMFSLTLFRRIGALSLGLPESATALLTFGVLLPPTLLMGMTLPLLVADGVFFSRRTGTTVGFLYFSNTLGSAFAAFAAVLVFMPLLGEQRSVSLAAGLNILVGVLVLLRSARQPTPT